MLYYQLIKGIKMISKADRKQSKSKNKKIFRIVKVINNPNKHSVLNCLYSLNYSNKKLSALTQAPARDLQSLRLSEIKSIQNPDFQLSKNEKKLKDKLLTLIVKIKRLRLVLDDPAYQLSLMKDVI